MGMPRRKVQRRGQVLWSFGAGGAVDKVSLALAVNRPVTSFPDVARRKKGADMLANQTFAKYCVTGSTLMVIGGLDSRLRYGLRPRRRDA